MPLLQSSLRMEGFIPPKCVEGDCDRDAHTRCRDCSFGAYYWTECCNELHRMKHQFHSPEVLNSFPAGYVTRVHIRTPNNCVARELALHAIVLKFGEQRDFRFRQSQTEFQL